MNDATMTAGGLVAAEVRAWLSRRNISAQQAASRIGWHQTYLSRRLTGVQQFSPDDLMALAELLGVPVTRFFDWPEEMEQEWAIPATVGRGFISGKDCDSWAGSSVLGGREPAAA